MRSSPTVSNLSALTLGDLVETLRESLATQIAAKLGVQPDARAVLDIARNAAQAVLSAADCRPDYHCPVACACRRIVGASHR